MPKIKFCLFFITVFLFLMALVNYSQAATINAASCSQSDVQTAISQAQNGDTVQIPNGSCTWSGSTLTITKAITLKGNGHYAISASGNPRTDLGTWPLTINSSGYSNTTPTISLNVAGSGNKVRITGISFTGNMAGSELYGGIQISANNEAQWRIDNSRFNISGRSINIQRSDKGLIDHVFITSTCDTNGEIAINDQRNDFNGDWAAAQPITWGGSDFVFIEDSAFIKTGCTAPTAITMVDTEVNGRAVIRHNYTYDNGITWHGFGSMHSFRGGNAFEIYNNEFYWHVIGNWMKTPINCRGGTALVYNNTFTNYQYMVSLRLERNESDRCSGQSWGCCYQGTYAWDGNTTPPGYPCADQVGRGKANGTTLQATQPQELRPVRIWNNTRINTNAIVNDAGETYVKSGRDYYVCDDNSCAESGYTPYAYPHPLQGGGVPGDTTPPGAPTGLTVR